MNLPAKTDKTAKAFTLIELLVVITIIAILVALLFPAISAVRNQARKTQASNDLHNIILAVKGYYTDYGKYPIDETGNDSTKDIIYGDVKAGESGSDAKLVDNNTLMDVLRNNVSGPNQTIVQNLNPRQTVYLDVPLSKSTPPKGGIDPDKGGFYDPWGTEYYVMIDANYDNQLTPPPSLPGLKDNSGSGSSTKPLSATVIAWSLGKKQQDTITTWR